MRCEVGEFKTQRKGKSERGKCEKRERGKKGVGVGVGEEIQKKIHVSKLHFDILFRQKCLLELLVG